VSDLELRNKIVEAARQYFFSNGFNKTTMEDFAHGIGMSKKTIYKFFPSKDDLIKEITRETLLSVHQACLGWHHDTSIDFLERIHQVTNYVSNEMRKMKPQFYIDVQRAMPDLWKEIDEFRSKRILEDFAKMVREGVEIGVLRKDINIDVLVLMHAHSIQAIINPETLEKLPLSSSQAYEAIIDIIFGGAFTPQAKEKYSHKKITTEVMEEIS
jgi:AcrR family transcriptional regulator